MQALDETKIGFAKPSRDGYGDPVEQLGLQSREEALGVSMAKLRSPLVAN